MTQKGRHTVIARCAIQSPGKGCGLVRNHRWGYHKLFFNTIFQVYLQIPIELVQYPFPQFLRKRIPVLTHIVGRIDHHKPVFLACWGIALHVFGRDIDIDRRVIS